RKALHLRSELHVAGHRLPGQERVALEDHPGARLDAGDRPGPQIDHALRRPGGARPPLPERRLAATAARFRKLVLPQPEPPTSQTNSPSVTARLRSFSATTWSRRPPSKTLVTR